jgi:hypothetical protein
MSVGPVNDAKPSDAPPFSEEINEGAMLAGIAAVIIVAGIVVCSIVNKGELQIGDEKPAAANDRPQRGGVPRPGFETTGWAYSGGQL